MQSHDLAGDGAYPLIAETERQSRSGAAHDPMLLIGVPLLLLTGAFLGLIHVLAWITLIGALLGS
jgi:hypothetical protein